MNTFEVIIKRFINPAIKILLLFFKVALQMYKNHL